MDIKQVRLVYDKDVRDFVKDIVGVCRDALVDYYKSKFNFSITLVRDGGIYEDMIDKVEACLSEIWSDIEVEKVEFSTVTWEFILIEALIDKSHVRLTLFAVIGQNHKTINDVLSRRDVFKGFIDILIEIIDALYELRNEQRKLLFSMKNDFIPDSIKEIVIEKKMEGEA